MNEKVHDAKDFGAPRSLLVYYRKKQFDTGSNKRWMKKQKTTSAKQSMTYTDKITMKKPDSECNEESNEEESKCQNCEKESWQLNIYILHAPFPSTAIMSLAAKFFHEWRLERVLLLVEASTSKIRNDNVVLNVKEKKRNAACSKNMQKEKSSEENRCSKTRNFRRQRMKRKQDPVLLNVLKDRHSKYYIKKNTPETSEAIDWDSVRMHKVTGISKAIQIRGMNNNLAERIKNCLKELVKNFGSTDS
ncbi:hypothetical protein C2S51_009096 [Perilla frutescens var. frutescens]|nr:hypothetical protein C2S51_009096 [Perilla frutescens var. frutescens]